MVLKFVSATRFLVIIPIIGLALTASVLFVLRARALLPGIAVPAAGAGIHCSSVVK